jgi:hypothetical protein
MDTLTHLIEYYKWSVRNVWIERIFELY